MEGYKASPCAVLLAAGRGSRLVPYTDALPTALISLGGRSLVAHSVAALRRLGVEDFYICRGWKGSIASTSPAPVCWKASA